MTIVRVDVEIMEGEKIPNLEVYIANPSITKLLTSFGAEVTDQNEQSSSLS